MSRRLISVLLACAGVLVACSGAADSGSGAASGSGGTTPAVGGGTVPRATTGTTATTGSTVVTPGTSAPPRVLPSGRIAPPAPAEERAVTLEVPGAPADADPAAIHDRLAFVAAQGANTVYVTASEADLENDTRLRAILDEAHDLGLLVVLDPLIGGTFRGDAGGSAAATLAAHPEWQATSRLGVAAGVPALNSATYRGAVLETLDRLLVYDIDGVVLDQPSYPLQPLDQAGDYFPFDADAQLQFESRFGHVLPPRETPEVAQFRRDSMKSFLEDLVVEVGNRRPDVSTRLLLPALQRPADTRLGTDDWNDLASIRSLDALQVEVVVGTDAGAFDAFVANESKLVDAVRPSQSAGMRIVAASLGDGPYDVVSAELDDARKHRVSQLVVAVSEQQPNAHPDLLWEQVRKAFGPPA